MSYLAPKVTGWSSAIIAPVIAQGEASDAGGGASDLRFVSLLPPQNSRYQYGRRPGEGFLCPKGFVGPDLKPRYEGR